MVNPLPARFDRGNNVTIDIVTCAHILAGALAADIAQQIAVKVARRQAMRRLSRGQ